MSVLAHPPSRRGRSSQVLKRMREDLTETEFNAFAGSLQVNEEGRLNCTQIANAWLEVGARPSGEETM